MPYANGNIADSCDENRLANMEETIREHFQAILDAMGIDTAIDHNTNGTAGRVAKMFVREVFYGRFQPRPKITEFPNAKRLDEIYTLGPIAVRSTCAHHFCPITGKLWVGILPLEKIIGISKIARLAGWIMARPQIQEEATIQLAEELESMIDPRGLGVVVKAQHACMAWRGVKEPLAYMVTSVMRGAFLSNPAARSEFMSLIASQGFHT